ncbi:mucin-2-like isoform X2 [Colius striatus]|uniref:mucin-2-like isoform X2 n=1 Tax=Colius striatus TaxID=57412 RepID=UPI002B1D764F|nr:mucin-2-like isoform X2 [Colius striatus]
MMVCSETEGAVAMAWSPRAHVATVVSWLWCKAFLLLAICLSAAALLYSLGSLAALPQASLGSLPPPRAWLGSPTSQGGTGHNLVATRGDLLNKPVLQQHETVPMGSVDTTGCFLGLQGDEASGADAEAWSLRTANAPSASPLTAQTSPQWQSGSRHEEGLRLGTAVAVTLSPAQRLGTGVPVTSFLLPQAVDDPTCGFPHPLALGRLHGIKPGSQDAMQVPAVTSTHGLGQPVDMAVPPSPAASSQGISHAWGEPAASLTRLWPPSLRTAASGPSAGAVLLEVVPTQVLPGGTQGPSNASVSAKSAWTLMGTPSQSRGTADQPRDDENLGLGPSPDHQTMHRRADLGLAAAPLVPLPGVPSALPTERTLSSTEMDPGTVWIPSAMPSRLPWSMQPPGIFLHGHRAALLADTALTKVPGNGSKLLAAVLAHDVNHPQVLAPFLPTTESEGLAVTLGNAQQTLPPSTEAAPSLTQSRATSAAGPAVTGVSLPEPGVSKHPSKDGGAIAASPFPRAAGGPQSSSLGSPNQRPPLHPLFTTASEDGPTAEQYQTMKVTEMSVLPGQMTVAEEDGHSEPRTASVGAIAAPAGPPALPDTSTGSVPPPSSKNSTPECCSEAVHQSGTSSPSPTYLPPSLGAVHAASSLPGSQTLAAPAGVTLDGQSASSHLLTVREQFPAAAGEAFTPAELMTGKRGTLGMKPPTSHPPRLLSSAQPLPVHVLPLWFRLLGMAYTEALSSRASESYRQLEEEVRLMLNQMLSTYETFLQANVLEFMNGSVVVRGEALFRGDVPAPTNSHLIRTVVTEASRKKSIFSWQLEPQSVQSSGFSLENLEPEKLSLSLTIFQLGSSRTDPLERLVSEVTSSLSGLYHVRNFTIGQLRNLSGNLEITGDIYLDTPIHANVADVLQALSACCMDLTSLTVEGARLHLQAYPVSFLIINRHFNEELLDPHATEHQELSRDLGDVAWLLDLPWGCGLSAPCSDQPGSFGGTCALSWAKQGFGWFRLPGGPILSCCGRAHPGAPATQTRPS